MTRRIPYRWQLLALAAVLGLSFASMRPERASAACDGTSLCIALGSGATANGANGSLAIALSAIQSQATASASNGSAALAGAAIFSQVTAVASDGSLAAAGALLGSTSIAVATNGSLAASGGFLLNGSAAAASGGGVALTLGGGPGTVNVSAAVGGGLGASVFGGVFCSGGAGTQVGFSFTPGSAPVICFAP